MEYLPSFKLSLPILSLFRKFYTITLMFASEGYSAKPLQLAEIDSNFVLSGRITHDKEISGIAKNGNTGILVSDEDSDVQILNFNKSVATITNKVPLLASGEEADLEAAAASKNGWFYATGSHGVTKKKSKRAQSRERVFRFKLSPDGRVVEKSAVSLTPHLRKIPELRSAVGRSLQADGINIEGLAASGNTLYFGFRRPNTGQDVLILEIPSPTLFDSAPGIPKLHRIPAQPGDGIRALETLADGSLLILLSGKKKTALISMWDPANPEINSAPIPLPASDSDGKAESIFVLDENPAALVFVVVYDSISGGGARTFRLSGSR